MGNIEEKKEREREEETEGKHRCICRFEGVFVDKCGDELVRFARPLRAHKSIRTRLRTFVSFVMRVAYVRT